MRARIGRERARRRFADYVSARLGPNYSEVAAAPFPPRHLLLATTASDETEFESRFDAGSAYPVRYTTGGYVNWLQWLGHLESLGFNLRTVGSVFELGCGAAPMLRHLRCLSGVRLVASDLNEDMVEWCRANVPGPTFHHNRLLPPLEFADDREFDLVYADSVFTHIPLDAQCTWLAEMRRIMRPGAWFVCSVLGVHHQHRFLDVDQARRLRACGSLELTSGDAAGVSLSTQAGGSAWDVYQTRAEVVRAYGAHFDIVDYVTTGDQDLLFLRAQ